MIKASVYGQCGRDPEQRQTRTGNSMMTASIAANVARADAEQDDTEWVQITAFGKVGGDDLTRHAKGDLIAVMGQLCRTHFIGRDGEARTNWSLTVKSFSLPAACGLAAAGGG